MIKAGESAIPEGASKDAVKSAKDERKQRKEVLMSGIVTAVGLTQWSPILETQTLQFWLPVQSAWRHTQRNH
jgi:hypothetical protein